MERAPKPTDAEGEYDLGENDLDILEKKKKSKKFVRFLANFIRNKNTDDDKESDKKDSDNLLELVKSYKHKENEHSEELDEKPDDTYLVKEFIEDQFEKSANTLSRLSPEKDEQNKAKVNVVILSRLSEKIEKDEPINIDELLYEAELTVAHLSINETDAEGIGSAANTVEAETTRQTPPHPREKLEDLVTINQRHESFNEDNEETRLTRKAAEKPHVGPASNRIEQPPGRLRRPETTRSTSLDLPRSRVAVDRAYEQIDRSSITPNRQPSLAKPIETIRPPIPLIAAESKHSSADIFKFIDRRSRGTRPQAKVRKNIELPTAYKTGEIDYRNMSYAAILQQAEKIRIGGLNLKNIYKNSDLNLNDLKSILANKNNKKRLKRTLEKTLRRRGSSLDIISNKLRGIKTGSAFNSSSRTDSHITSDVTNNPVSSFTKKEADKIAKSKKSAANTNNKTFDSKVSKPFLTLLFFILIILGVTIWLLIN
jgi:hypothetical protein